MLESLKPLFTFIKSVYSDNGQGSSTRVHMGAIIAFVLGVGVSFSVSVHHKLITLEQFDAFLGAAGTFIVTVCGTLYGINKAGSYFDGKNGNDKQPPSA
jgi:hypothetical protein